MEKKHLSKEVLDFMEACNADDTLRIKRILTDTWINYPLAINILELADRMITRAKMIRPQCLLVIGDPQTGKSSIKVRIESLYPDKIDGSGKIERPILSIVMPAESDIRALANNLLNNMGLPEHTGRPDQVLRNLYKNLHEYKVKAILIDELHHIGHIPSKKQRILLDVLKNITSITQIPIIAFGIEEAGDMLSSDTQLYSRFTTINLKFWGPDDDTRRLLSSIESTLPLKEPSNLSDKEMAITILEKTNGTIGELVRLCQELAVVTIASAKESITLDLVKSHKFHTSKPKIVS
jgi:hypothetical protein